MSKKTVFVTLTGAIFLDGEIVTAGETVEVTEKEARNLLLRGKGTLVDAPAPEPEDLSKLTVDALRAIAGDLGIQNVKDLRKAELIKAIEQAQAAE